MKIKFKTHTPEPVDYLEFTLGPDDRNKLKAEINSLRGMTDHVFMDKSWVGAPDEFCLELDYPYLYTIIRDL